MFFSVARPRVDVDEGDEDDAEYYYCVVYTMTESAHRAMVLRCLQDQPCHLAKDVFTGNVSFVPFELEVSVGGCVLTGDSPLRADFVNFLDNSVTHMNHVYALPVDLVHDDMSDGAEQLHLPMGVALEGNCDFVRLCLLGLVELRVFEGDPVGTPVLRADGWLAVNTYSVHRDHIKLIPFADVMDYDYQESE
jgi:hypothetical protein